MQERYFAAIHNRRICSRSGSLRSPERFAGRREWMRRHPLSCIIYNLNIPTKTTKTTKSLVVVLRFCSKLRSREKQGFVRRNSRPPCTLLAGVAMHTGRSRSCTRRGCGCRERKEEKTPGAERPEKPLPPLLTQIGGKGLFNPQKRNFLNNPHCNRITKIKQIQRNNNIQTDTNKSQSCRTNKQT